MSFFCKIGLGGGKPSAPVIEAIEETDVETALPIPQEDEVVPSIQTAQDRPKTVRQINIENMYRVRKMNEESLEQGNNGIGWWFGTEAINTVEIQNFEPVFIFSTPITTNIPYEVERTLPDETDLNYQRFKKSGKSLTAYNQDYKDDPSFQIKEIIRTVRGKCHRQNYVGLSPRGAFSIIFAKKNVDDGVDPQTVNDFDNGEAGESNFLTTVKRINDELQETPDSTIINNLGLHYEGGKKF